METTEHKQDTMKEETPICRLCLQERDYWGNFAVVYEDGLIQHRSCMAKYSKNRRALKRIIFKVKYQEYLGDMRPAGIVDREAMKIQEKSLKELKKEKRINQKQIDERMAHARKCKAEKQKGLVKEREKEIEDFIKSWRETSTVSGVALIEGTQERK